MTVTTDGILAALGFIVTLSVVIGLGVRLILLPYLRDNLVKPVDVIRDQVKNTHSSNLRDDIDRKHAESMAAISQLGVEIADIKERQNIGAQLIAGVIERGNDADKAIVRLHERIDTNHPPTP